MARESCNFDKDEAEILKPSSSSPPPSTSPPPPPPPPLLSLRQKRKAPEIDLNEDFASSDCAHRPDDEGESRLSVGFSNRCSACRKKVGLTSFRCRCGGLFCGRHRHSEAHRCSFDYKAAGREEIARANPLIRAAKIIKI
ncbi:Zinc finger AN1 domain-containing stress-associated protein 15 [Ananas comosus]|uniref:Zinc finger AN1 domain-containing stress-associated protein 15 n=2 Tax=Ananas comosus TaxID=4615 RepID=A0A199V3V7_ANACO|nr:Zinc finger AN1 domain-containing stress-associated protein 15 [Ananas comosus]CAD1819963.1 unnamed protein product [Ananas comosus var. bracteatus]